MARRVNELSTTARRRALVRTVAEIVASSVVLVGLYYLLPVDSSKGDALILRVLIVVIVLAATLIWQLSRIVKADLPELRAAVSMGFLIPLFFVLFATTYLSMSHGSPTSFTQVLDHTRALYFTVTVFSTVGFGDITPTTDAGRGVVTVQMILDLIIIGVVFRVLLTAARTGLSADDEAGDSTGS
jgi:voltage-gated potassium channel